MSESCWRVVGGFQRERARRRQRRGPRHTYHVAVLVLDDEDALPHGVDAGAARPAHHLLVLAASQEVRGHVGRAQDHPGGHGPGTDRTPNHNQDQKSESEIRNRETALSP